MGKLLITKFKGINSSKAALQLQNGEAPFLQNFRGRPFDNLAKRRGVEPSSSQSGPVQGIFELEFDEVIIPMFIVDGTLIFYPKTASFSWPTPSPFPPFSPIDPGGNNVNRKLNIEPAMRAIQERALATGNSSINTFPNRIFNTSGNKINGNTGQAPAQQDMSIYWPSDVGFADFPVNNFYQGDVSFYDSSFGQPTGTRAAQLVNILRSAVSTVAPYYYESPEGKTSATPYDDTSIHLPSSATRTTYKQVLEDLKSCIKLMTNTVASVSFTCEEKDSGEFTDGTCLGAQAAAITSFNSGSYSPAILPVISFAESTVVSGGVYFAQIAISRGKISADLSNYTGSSALLFVKTFDDYTSEVPTANPCPITPDKKYHVLGDLSIGSINLTGFYPTSVSATFTGCPTPGPGAVTLLKEWVIDSGAAFLTLTFTNNV